MKSGEFLELILESKRREVEANKNIRSLPELKALSRDAPLPRDFEGALRRPRISLIAEVKKASPSRGILQENFQPVEIALAYEEGGARAISVLTDEEFFHGHLDHIDVIKEAVRLPVLRKDFIIDPYQVYESRVAGADAILLIVACLPDKLLGELYILAKEIGLVSLVEVHNRSELDRVLDLGAEVIGINNRDLKTFATSIEVTLGLMRDIPRDRVVVSESGITERNDVQRLDELGVHAILVGEALMKAHNVKGKIRELIGVSPGVVN